MIWLIFLEIQNMYQVPNMPKAVGERRWLSDSKAQEVLNNSIQGGKQRYGISDGKLYEFQPDNVGGWHGYPMVLRLRLRFCVSSYRVET
jgi:hypothetical protein